MRLTHDVSTLYIIYRLECEAEISSLSLPISDATLSLIKHNKILFLFLGPVWRREKKRRESAAPFFKLFILQGRIELDHISNWSWGWCLAYSSKVEAL